MLTFVAGVLVGVFGCVLVAGCLFMRFLVKKIVGDGPSRPFGG